jgi:hypothetical protein
MGYTTRPGEWIGTYIREYQPDDTNDKFYRLSPVSLEELTLQAKDKWPDGWVDLKISVEHIHTRFVTSSEYDPEDWDYYVVVERT